MFFTLLVIFLATNSAPPIPPPYQSAMKTADGIQAITFTTPEGDIRVNLPENLALGDTISASIDLIQGGALEPEKTNHLRALKKYVLEIDNLRRRVLPQCATWVLPSALSSGAVEIVLRNDAGEIVDSISLEVLGKSARASKAFLLPRIGQQGRLMTLFGPFDGDFSTTALNMDGKEVRLIAESPRTLIVRGSTTSEGATLMTLLERTQRTENEFHNVAVRLAAPRTDIVRGESTTLTVVVRGLEGITEPVSFLLENSSTDVITMGGGNRQTLQIAPADLVDGTYTFKRSLTAIKRGGWSITGSIISRP